MNEMEKFEGELAVKRAGLQALRLNVADPSTLMQLKGVFNVMLDYTLLACLVLHNISVIAFVLF